MQECNALTGRRMLTSDQQLAMALEHIGGELARCLGRRASGAAWQALNAHLDARFYGNRFAGSFARNVPFQDNPCNGDRRICGACASLAGLEHGDPHAVRATCEAFTGSRLIGFLAGNQSVRGYFRGQAKARVPVLANFSEGDQHCPPLVFSTLPASAVDLLSGRRRALRLGVTLAPYEALWLDCQEQPRSLGLTQWSDSDEVNGLRCQSI